MDAKDPNSVASSALYRIHRLSMDLVRNSRDRDLRLNFGETTYFIDPNLIETFIDPESELIKGDFSSLRAEPNQEVRAIIAMITTEYIISGGLPGTAQGSLFITKWHREELANRLLDHHSKTIAELVGVDADEEAESRAQQIKQILESNDTEVRNYNLAKYVAKHSASRSLRQQSRFYATGLRSYQDLLGNQGEEESAIDWMAWVDIIVKQGKKPTNPLVADAKSIALIQWISDVQLGGTMNRAVLITRDEMLYDAYRKWYYGLPLDIRTGKRFVLRRASQYLPQINLADSNNLISKHNKEQAGSLFRGIDQLVGTAGIPEALRSLVRSDGKATNYNLLEEWDFEALEAEDSTQQLRDALKEAVENLCDVEQGSIALFSEYVQRRFSNESIADFELLDEAEIAARINSELLSLMLESTTDLLKSIRSTIADIPLGGWHRIPRTLIFPIGESTLADEVARCVDLEIELPDLVADKPAIEAFALCAGFALAAHDSDSTTFDIQRHAVRYAELCIQTSALERSNGVMKYEFESHFLTAMVYRFLLGASVLPELCQRYFDEARQYLDKAVPCSRSQLLRKESEAGALHMFMATHLLRLAKPIDALKTLSIAKDGLLSCKEMLSLEDKHDAQTRGAYDQVIHNLAAISVIRRIGEGEHYDLDADEESLIEVVEQVRSDPRSWEPLFFGAELSCFCALSRSADSETLSAAIDASDASSDSRLLVDRWQAAEMADLLRRRRAAIGAVTGHPDGATGRSA